MAETDFEEVLARLLTDGELRDALASNPQATSALLSNDANIQIQLFELKREDLEYQAEVLLRKRLGVVKRILPVLVDRLEPCAWPIFKEYARNRWHQADQDALRFADYVGTKNPELIDLREMNRLRFSTNPNQKIRFYWIASWKCAPTLQILVRNRKQWREYLLSLRF